MYLRFNLIYIFIGLIIFNGCERKSNPVQSNDGVPPSVPTRLNIYYSQDGAIGLEWYPNPEPDIKGYNVYRKINDGSYSFLKFTKNFYLVDDSLSYNDTYFYKVSAIDNGDLESQASVEVSAMPLNKTPPKSPGGLVINARNWEGNVSVHLEWNKNTESDVADYLVYRDTLQGFIPDSSKLVGLTDKIEFSDTTGLKFYTNYFYRIKAVDKGGLESKQSDEVSDQIYTIPQILFPGDSSYPGYFTSFRIKTINRAANYRVIVQTNKYFGDFWSKKFTSTIVNDTIDVTFDPPYLYNGTYYWRVATFSENNDSPNSITQQYQFTIK